VLLPRVRRLTVLALLAALLLGLLVLQGGTAGSAAAEAGVAPSDPPQRTVTYSVRTRGTVYGDVQEFRRLASVTLNDRRGWSLGGAIRFREVSSNPDFVLWLAAPSSVAAFGSICDSTYSCRVGDNVVINDLRWRKGTPVWRDVAEYHHYVVNHEVGHWLGMRHRFCTGKGDLAPAMQQQSIGLHGCVTNTWPTAAEKSDVARRYRVTVRSSRPDVYALKAADAGMQVHVLDGQTGYDRFDGHFATAAARTSFARHDFVLADRNRDGVDDLIGIKKSSSSSHVEVHVLDGASRYRTWQLHVITPLVVGAPGRWSYDAADVDADGYLDVVAVDRQGAGGAHTTVRVLDGATGYRSLLLTATTPLPALTGAGSAFALGDHDRDGIPDLYAVRRTGTASHHTEVDVIDGSSGYRTRTAHIATPLPWTDTTWDFAVDDWDGDGWTELWAIKRNGGSGRTEVHVLADRTYSRWVAHSVTPVPQTGGSDIWRFPVG
jgi:hypothetical protein